MTLYFFVYTFNSGKGNSQMANEFRIKNGAISPNIVITDTTASSSKTTGALQVAGGAGIVGNVYANAFYGNATGLTSIPGGNVSGTVPTSTTSGTVTTAAQPNITSVGTLTSITTSGIVTCSNTTVSTSKTTGATVVSGGIGVGGNVYANAFYGSATGLTSIPGGNVSGEVGIANTVSNPTQSNITSVGTLISLTISGSALVESASGKTSILPSAISIGRVNNVASSPIIDFNSGSISVDYDSRFGCTGGNGVSGYGNVYLLCGLFESAGKIGYRAGTGSTVTQLTSRTTGVTINTVTGRITLVSATTTAGQVSTFTVTNSSVTATDSIIITQYSGTGHYIATVKSIANGSFTINIYTPTAISSAESPAFNFSIIQGKTA